MTLRGISQAPGLRRLRIFAFDPSLAQRIDTLGINTLAVRLTWERDARTGKSLLQKGPIGEYLEVIDVDPASGMAYFPVDLDDGDILAQDGLPPSEGNPQFHQQMVYAVAMTTISQFERALGRVALWGTHREKGGEEQFVRRLRLYPHALRDRNAYYSPDKKAILFGYFPVRAKDEHNTPGTLVFTCLSHDIIAHEVTHALLDGVHPRFNEPTNPDVHAFHEAFADIVAMFQHFSYPGILQDQITRTRGDLESESLLGQLAQQFGRATSRASALRDALGSVGEDGKWRRRNPDPRAMEKVLEAHGRGAILVAAVFGAFLLVYRARTADLFRIASQGTGVMPVGDIHPDLARRLAEEASRCAQYVLQMCIRALDYCPPVDITFGDYLRAIITGDVELNPEDELGYRVAMIQSFRQWGIYPPGVRSMSIDSLLWPTGREAGLADDDDLRSLLKAPEGEATNNGETPGRRKRARQFEAWNLESDRFAVWQRTDDNRWVLWRWLMHGDGRKHAEALGLVLDNSAAPRTVYRNDKGDPSVEVHSVRMAQRRSARGTLLSDLVVEITQRRRGYFDPDEQARQDAPGQEPMARAKDGDFRYRSGCTVLIDPTTMAVRRVMRTAGTVASNHLLERVRGYLTGEAEGGTNAFHDVRRGAVGRSREPFAMLHREDGE